MPETNKNILERFLSNEEDKKSIIGNEVIHLRSYSAIQKLNRKTEEPVGFLFFQALLILSLASINSFLAFLYLRGFPFVVEGSLSGEAIAVCFYLVVFSFILLSPSIFNKNIIPLWLCFLLGFFIYFTLNMLFYKDLSEVLYRRPIPIDFNIPITVITTLALAFYALILWKSFLHVMTLLMSAIFVLFTISLALADYPIVQGNEAAKNLSKDNTNILHINLSNHASIEFLGDIYNNINSKPAHIMAGFYKNRGFDFHPKVYSNYSSSLAEMASLVNIWKVNPLQLLIPRRYMHSLNTDNGIDMYLTENVYFSLLQQSGYSINIYQANTINYCAMNMHDIYRCNTFPLSYALNMNRKFLAGAFFGQLFPSEKIGEISNKILGIVTMDDIRDPRIQMVAFNRLEKDILEAKGKNMFFLDSSILHPPFIYDDKCNITVPSYDFNGYTEQLSCTYRRLSHLMEKLDEAGILERTTVIIHGDGGAKINHASPLLPFNTEEGIRIIKEYYGTIFAMYTPNQGFLFRNKACDLQTVFVNSVLAKQDNCRELKLDYFFTERISLYYDSLIRWLSTPLLFDTDMSLNYYKKWLKS